MRPSRDVVRPRQQGTGLVGLGRDTNIAICYQRSMIPWEVMANMTHQMEVSENGSNMSLGSRILGCRQFDRDTSKSFTPS